MNYIELHRRYLACCQTSGKDKIQNQKTKKKRRDSPQ
jgi:hypothetical protein